MLRNRFACALAAMCVFVACASRCNAWNSTGHEIVAQIAYDQLSPNAKTVIINLLKGHPRVNEDLLHDEVRAKDDDLAMFLRAATWPDIVRYPAHPLTHLENHPKWHYVDFPFETEGVTGPKPELQWDGKSDPANLAEAMQKAIAELNNPVTPKVRKAIAICWVEHLVGDIHQPLHATSWFSKEYPEGDQGGNLVVIKNGNGEVLNLHSYWDGMEGMSMDPADVRKAADRIEGEHPAAEFKAQIADLSVVDWAQESLALAKSVVYLDGTLRHTIRRRPTTFPTTRSTSRPTTFPSDAPELPAGYAEKGLAIADQRIALAGYRLAAVLEQIAKAN